MKVGVVILQVSDKDSTMTATAIPATGRQASPHWQISDIRYDCIDHAAIAHHEDMFYLLMSASFIERSSELFSRKLRVRGSTLSNTSSTR